MNMLPTLHKPVPMNTRAVVPAEYEFDDSVPNKVRVGTVVGIAHMHAVFHYIVLLDEPFQSEFGEQRAIVLSGSQIETPEGTNFRLP